MLARLEHSRMVETSSTAPELLGAPAAAHCPTAHLLLGQAPADGTGLLHAQVHGQQSLHAVHQRQNFMRVARELQTIAGYRS